MTQKQRDTIDFTPDEEYENVLARFCGVTLELLEPLRSLFCIEGELTWVPNGAVYDWQHGDKKDVGTLTVYEQWAKSVSLT